jgi:hypothetical protein
MGKGELIMDIFFTKLKMETCDSNGIGKIKTDNIDDAIWVYIPDKETAEQLSEWSKVNNYPAFVGCVPGQYHWDDESETFYKEN